MASCKLALPLILAGVCLLALCEGGPVQKAGGQSAESAQQQRRREVSSETGICEEILCAPLGANCKVAATREPAQLVGSNGAPCPVCPVCIDYIGNLP